MVIYIAYLRTGIQVPMLTLSALGGAEVVIAISPILLFAVDREIGIRVLTLIVGSLYVSGLLKQALHAPRPTWVNGSVAAWVCACFTVLFSSSVIAIDALVGKTNQQTEFAPYGTVNSYELKIPKESNQYSKCVPPVVFIL